MKTKPIPRPFPFLPSVASLPRLTRRRKDLLAEKSLLLISGVPLFVTGILIIALWVKTRPLLETQPLWQLLSGATWRPLKGEFGFLPFITGTLWVTATALVLAVPPCLLSAIYLAEYARPAIRTLMKPLLDLLAAIPSVVYGVWGLVAIVPWVQRYLAPQLGKRLGFIPIFALNNPTGFSVLSGGIVLAVMIVPFVIAVTYEVLQAVPAGVREASLAVGATRWQTVKYAVLPHVIPGVVAGTVLGASRALGETMAVLMVIGNVARSPTSVFDPAYPLTALIANNYGEMLSIPLYDSALMGAALLLLVIVLLFNLASTLVLRKVIRK
jgi:phosphate transport system permease protein